MRKNCFVESAILYPKTVKFENLKKIAKAQFSLALPHMLQVIKTFSMREGWWYIGIKGGGGVKSKGTRIVIEKEKRDRPILAACRHV